MSLYKSLCFFLTLSVLFAHVCLLRISYANSYAIVLYRRSHRSRRYVDAFNNSHAMESRFHSRQEINLFLIFFQKTQRFGGLLRKEEGKRERGRKRKRWNERKEKRERERDRGTRREQQIEQKPSETGRFVVARQWLEGIIHRCNRLRAHRHKGQSWPGLVSATRSELRYFEQRIRRPRSCMCAAVRYFSSDVSIPDDFCRTGVVTRHSARYYPCSRHIAISLPPLPPSLSLFCV